MSANSEKPKPAILDGKFFEAVEINNNAVKAKCMICEKSSTSSNVIIRGSLHPTSNFTSHLQKCHINEYKDYMSYKESPAVKNKRARQTTLEFPQTGESSKKVKIADLIMDFVVGTMSPLSIVEHKSFRKLITGLDPKVEVFSRDTLTTKLEERKTRFDGRLRKQIATISEFCVTTDIWSSRRRSYLGATIHWISNDFERKSGILALKRFKGSHTFDRIAEMLNDIFTSFGLSKENITTVVTDNGSNFVKAFRVFGIEVDAAVSNEYDLVTSLGPEIEEIDISEDGLDEQPSELVHEDMDQILNELAPAARISLPRHSRCASHTLSLVATDDCKLTDMDLTNAPNFKRVYRSAMAKCAALWNKISNRSTKTAEALHELCGKSIIKPVPTRWNSLFDSIGCLLQFKDKFKHIFQIASVAKLSDEETIFLEDYVVAMKPVAAALDKLQSQKDFFYGYLAPVITQANQKLQNIIDNVSNRKFTTPLATTLKDSLQDRFEPICTMDKISARDEILAAISMPYFKLRWIPENKRDELLLFFKQEAKLFADPVETIVRQGELQEVDDFFEFETTSSTATQLGQNAVELECIRYLQDTSQELNSLDQFPIIKKMFLHFNTPLPSSAPSERLFNYARMVMRPNRYSLSDPIFELLVLLKVNGDELEMI